MQSKALVMAATMLPDYLTTSSAAKSWPSVTPKGVFTLNKVFISTVYGKKNRRSRQVRAVYCDGSICEMIEHTTISNEQLLTLDVDILIPAALEGVITRHNADAIQAKAIIEIANGPILYEADKIIHEKGIRVVPDVLANAGGVSVSYFEWVQNRSGQIWLIDEVHQKLKDKMTDAFLNVWQIAEDEKLSLREAAYVKALRRINSAISAHGTKEYFAKQ